MGPLLVEDADELIEPGLLLQEVLRWRLGGFRHTDSRVKPKSELALAKGDTLSARIARGSPKSLNARSNTVKAIHRLSARERLAADQIATGKVADGERIAERRSASINSPLEAAHHRSLGGSIRPGGAGYVPNNAILRTTLYDVCGAVVRLNDCAPYCPEDCRSWLEVQ